MKNLCLSFLCLFSASVALSAQSGNQLYDPTVLHEIKLTFVDTTFWDSLLVYYDDSSSFSGSDIQWLLVDKIEIDGTELDSELAEGSLRGG